MHGNNHEGGHFFLHFFDRVNHTDRAAFSRPVLFHQSGQKSLFDFRKTARAFQGVRGIRFGAQGKAGR